MSVVLAKTLEALANRIVALAENDSELTSLLRQLAEQFLQQTEPKIEETGIEAAKAVPLQTVDTQLSIFAPSVSPEHELLAPRIEVPIGWAKRLEVANIDLKLVESRCRLKAEGARWAATRQRRIREGAVIIIRKSNPRIGRSSTKPNPLQIVSYG